MNLKRSIIGSLVSLIIAGEVMAASGNALFTIPGFVVLFLFYFVYFHLIDAFRSRCSPSFNSLILFNFALYSVFFTGFLHGELLNFLKPQEFIITLLIRIQASLFILFIFPLVDRFAPLKGKGPGWGRALLYLGLFLLLTLPSDVIGLRVLGNTVSNAPLLSILFAAFALLSLYIASTHRAKRVNYPSGITLWVTALLAFVPFTPFFIVYAIVMISIALRYETKN